MRKTVEAGVNTAESSVDSQERLKNSIVRLLCTVCTYYDSRRFKTFKPGWMQ